MKEQEKTPKKELKEKEASNLSDIEFKTLGLGLGLGVPTLQVLEHMFNLSV